VSQNNIDQGQAIKTPAQETRTFIRQVRAATRRKYAPEDKIRIVLEGSRRELTVIRVLCKYIVSQITCP